MSNHGSDQDDTRELLIIYATETGNAQDTADYIARQCRRIHIRCRISNIEDITVTDLLYETVVVFVISTTGSGVEPRSMTPLWTSLLRSNLPKDTFEDLSFTVFGLGDTAYEKFCWAAKKLSRRMQSLGATEFVERGEGDDQHQLGLDGTLRPWTESLVTRLVDVFPLPEGLQIEPNSRLPPPRVSLKSADDQKADDQEARILGLPYYQATVKANRRTTPPEWYQDVRQIELGFNEDIMYEPGDVAVIHPITQATEVEQFLVSLDWGENLDNPLEFKKNVYDQSIPPHIPKVTTLRCLFSRFLDFNAVPRRAFFQFLRHFTTDELEREKLDDFLSVEGADELYEYCYRVRRTIQEVLQEFRSVKIPMDYIFDVFPPLRPREFSIASSVTKHPREIQLCIAIVRYRTKLKLPRKGVCTSYISALQQGDAVQVGIKKGFIKLPTNLHTPVLCIGPGTGIAPMRAVMEKRIALGAYANSLYFGCRSSQKDHHYGSEWKEYSSQQKLHYRVAFSRDQPEGEKRIYVQDLIMEDAEHIWNVIGLHKGWVYISGSSNKMPSAVKEAIARAVEIRSGLSADAAQKYVRDMVLEGRLMEECWG
ncbi:hypothetical protein CPB83DRAFT_766075 [Crepidotus variabilis]|uniref:NADPH-dependent diflavin oxidoreductase 1 n=1 Tax=Crepidotus variabilis TaxID=179855 RepID=A0A9P6EGS3_9AGAR|nr:hypothetical protein CPB83DRAFT_766075 [Crepidotus variabilis]